MVYGGYQTSRQYEHNGRFSWDVTQNQLGAPKEVPWKNLEDKKSTDG